MNLLSAFSLVVALLMPAWQPQAAPLHPAPDRNAFTFLNWDLNLRLETASGSLFVRGKIKFRNDSQQPQRLVSMQISSSLRWASIQQSGAAIPFSSSLVRSDLDHSGNVQEAVVTLPAAVAPGSTAELEVGYSGPVSLDTTRLAQLGVPLEVRAATDYDRITPTFTCLRGVGHVLWFPVSLEPAVMSEGSRVFDEASAWAVRHSSSTMKVSLTDSQTHSLRTNAQMDWFEFLGNVHMEEHEWKHLGVAGPILVGGDYQALSEPPDAKKLPLAIDFFREHEIQAQDYARVVRETPAMVSGRSDLPVAMIELPETEDAPFDGDSILLTPFKTTDRKSLELTVAYLLAHKTLWSPRAWIYEGAAHLAQALMRERQDGRAAAIAYMEQRLAPLTLADSGAAATAKSNSLVNTTGEVFYRTKAMYVWWMLREIVGERALLDSLEQYDPAADREPSYMQKLLEKNSHRDLEWFFDDWVYTDRGLPEFTVSNGYARPSLQGIFLVSATIENQGEAAAEVPVIVRTEGGNVVTRVRVPGKGKTAARVEVNSRPIDVTVNDGSVPEIDRSGHTTAIRIGNE